MPSVRDLRDRIKSLKNTQQITKAMKQVAAAKIRRAEMVQKQARPYAEGLAEMLRDLMDAVGNVDHPFMRPGKQGAPAGVILMTADKGLAGAFNSNVIREAERYARGKGVQWYAVGNKARNAVRRMRADAGFSESLNTADKLALTQDLAAKVSDDFTSGKISEIVLVSQKLVSVMVQRPDVRTLVPITADDAAAKGGQAAKDGGSRDAADAKKDDSKGARGAVEFAPSAEAVLTRLLPKYLEFTLFSAMLETDAAFYSAQLIAMTNATDNAGKLLDDLTLAMNKARQAAITKEMLEIVGGAEAQSA